MYNFSKRAVNNSFKYGVVAVGIVVAITIIVLSIGGLG
jgi:hypothetical protein